MFYLASTAVTGKGREAALTAEQSILHDEDNSFIPPTVHFRGNFPIFLDIPKPFPATPGLYRTDIDGQTLNPSSACSGLPSPPLPSRATLVPRPEVASPRGFVGLLPSCTTFLPKQSHMCFGTQLARQEAGMLHGFFPLAYLIYFLDPSIYPIEGPAVCDVVHQENALREENTRSVRPTKREMHLEDHCYAQNLKG